jgi:hypothetical protein
VKLGIILKQIQWKLGGRSRISEGRGQSPKTKGIALSVWGRLLSPSSADPSGGSPLCRGGDKALVHPIVHLFADIGTYGVDGLDDAHHVTCENGRRRTGWTPVIALSRWRHGFESRWDCQTCHCANTGHLAGFDRSVAVCQVIRRGANDPECRGHAFACINLQLMNKGLG